MPRKATKPIPVNNDAVSTVSTYRHEATRKNIPPAGLAAQGKIAEVPKVRYAYDPHLPPELRFDPTGAADHLLELLEAARTRTLTAAETALLAEALRNQQPWLEWAGKRERRALEVDPVALHIHERVSAQAILKVAAREQVQRSLFADPEQEYREAVRFYQHDVNWANRMILGDSLQVMASLARRENLAGKVQMIYIDPPYGIKFGSNFQPEIGRRDVKDKESDLTREPEMVRAYRDTWTLGVHSYLSYLRDRLVVARELLADSGSVFVQISDENLHRVRAVMDEAFGVENCVSVITFAKTSSATGNHIASAVDYLIWYAKDIKKLKYNRIFKSKSIENDVGERFTRVELPDGTRRFMLPEERNDVENLPAWSRIYRHDNLTSQSGSDSTNFPVTADGVTITPNRGYWKTNQTGMRRLVLAHRIAAPSPNSLAYVRFIEDFPVSIISNIWTDTITGAFTDTKVYVVQTNTKVIQRCILMTTDPGDLVLDPTCGSGTTAYVAEQWGRRWITVDTSRVALALARQRMLTASFPMYKVKNGEVDGAPNPDAGFVYKTVPHITLKSIAQNVALDAIFARHQPLLDQRLAALNQALQVVTPELRQRLRTKLLLKQKQQGKRAISDADTRRWELPKKHWEAWQVPFDSDEEWPPALQQALQDYRAAWRAKMDEVNAAIAANAEQEELVDQPDVVRGVTRVAGPYTIESVLPAALTLDASPIGGEPDELESFDAPAARSSATNAEAHLDKILRLLKADGVRFPNNRVVRFVRLEPLVSGTYLHAEGEWASDEDMPRRVAVSVGPEHGAVTAMQVEEALRHAYRRAYDDLVFAGFSFDATAQGVIQDDTNPQVRCHLAHIRPDMVMDGLLKEAPNAQLFTVFGQPRTSLRQLPDGEYEIEMEGVDIYNPVENTILPTSASKVAAWFLDSDYDGRTFCITQAFFPDKSAWAKIARALKGVIDEQSFGALSGTTSLPFPIGKHRRAAVKVIDPRGNEVLRVHSLDETSY
ncbi:MAG: site-specific DNA-methyltransferase [Candidatus Viridilinea halotolerans]|uniref:Site-specific DNA-methyltransferase n=1 Tax=Candidatus Viridilinea halotolerans TaxID=2491704 RepID=A0A426U0E4_9CHLR|nr:MAG: site-specific DNA-methyltransferase [Candidatus Viridilinea halotolerans]